MTEAQHFDLIIVGAGAAGLALAHALLTADPLLSLALIDANPPPAVKKNGAAPQRPLALTLASQQLLATLEVWPQLSTNATAIECIHVSRAQKFGLTQLTAEAAGVTALGYVIGISDFVTALYECLTKHSLTCFHETRVTAMSFDPDIATLSVIDGQEQQQALTTPLVIGADGSHSGLTEMAGLTDGVVEKSYREHAIVAQITAELSLNTAFERFTDVGTLAFLPQSNHRYGMVWSLPSSQMHHQTALDDTDLLARIQQHFGHRLGQFTAISARQSYPLSARWISCPYRNRFLLLGNAAHTLHPVAAQGFNLTLRDIGMLTETLIAARRQQEDHGQLACLRTYQQKRAQDQKWTQTFTDGLIHLWQPESLIPNSLKAIGLTVLDNFPSAKRFFMKRSMGFTPPISKLIRGRQP